MMIMDSSLDSNLGIYVHCSKLFRTQVFYLENRVICHQTIRLLASGVWDVVGEAYCQRRVTVRDACGCDVKVFVIPAIWRTDVDLRGVPKAKIELVSRPETGDISPMLLSYNIGLQYKQFKWRLVKKASQVLYLHFALKKRAFIEELYEKQEQVKEWLQSMGIVDQTAVVQDDDEPDDGAIPLHHQVSVKNRNVPSIAALPIIRPALGGKQSISDRGKVAMQSSLNHFLGNMDIVNSREACKFLEVSKLSFILQYGSKLKEGYIMVRHLPGADSELNCCVPHWCGCCQGNWKKVLLLAFYPCGHGGEGDFL